MEEWKDGRLWLNPGSCGRRRFRLDISMAVLHLKDGKISVEKVLISGGAVRNTKEDYPGVSAEGILNKIEVNESRH